MLFSIYRREGSFLSFPFSFCLMVYLLGVGGRVFCIDIVESRFEFALMKSMFFVYEINICFLDSEAYKLDRKI